METTRSPVTGVKISSVVPASVTGENKPRHLTTMDLAMKLHYVRAVYFFKGTTTTRGTDTGGGFNISDFKTSMFALLQFQCYHHVSGRIRIRTPENDVNDRPIPYIRCNDSGIRVVEANVEEFTVEEWLRMEDRSVDHRFLVYDHVLGPDLAFSPLVFLQITQFKCGGFSIGLNWAHILGDIFSASTFMNTIGQMMLGHAPPEPVYPETPKMTSQDGDGEAISIKKIKSVGDHWLVTNKCKMGRFIFNFTLDQINHLMAKYPIFSEVDILCAVIWKSLLNIRGKSDTNVITIVDRKKSLICWNDDLIISVVERKGEIIGITELATLIASEKREENKMVKRLVEKDKGISDFITYGSNLTSFVNLDMINTSKFEIKGEKPDFVNYTIHGVGDKGVVLVYPKGEFARIVSVVMPEEELPKLRDEVINMII